MRTLVATLLTFLAATLAAAPKVTTLPSPRNTVPAFVDPGARRVVLVILENGIAALLHVKPPAFDEAGVRPIGGIWKQ